MTFEQMKEHQRLAWGAAPFEKIEGSIAAMHDDLVVRLDPRPGERWLDVACGTGAVAMRAARAGADVTGIDLSDVMVETARRRADEAGARDRLRRGRLREPALSGRELRRRLVVGRRHLRARS